MSVSPGIIYSLILTMMDNKEREIIEKLSRVWYITFAKKTSFKNDNFAFVFAKPTEKLIDAFYLEREVLVVFNSRPNFDPRTLDFVDKTIAEYQNRLDKLCVIIISQDKRIKESIRKIVIQDKESRILIPYSYDEFSNGIYSSDDLIYKRLKEFFYERDLFAFESPLRNDIYFFGRNSIIQHLYGKYKSGENSCLFGLRKIGKTSSLFAVKRYLELREEPVVFLDCSETAFHRRRWYEALFFMVHELAKKFKIEKELLHSEKEYNDKTASQFFEEELKRIQMQQGGKRLLFILDEIENITFDISPSAHWAIDKDYLYFWQSIRSVFQKNAELFSFTIAGVNPKAVETPRVQGFDNPIYKLITPVYLTLFDVNEVRDMVSSIGSYMGLRFDEEVFTYLTDDYGGHPFLTRQVCSRIHLSTKDTRPCKVSKYRYQQDEKQISQHIQDYIGLIVDILYEKYNVEYDLLECLAQGDQKTFMEYVELSPSLIEHLLGYGLIKMENDIYHFRIKAVEDYIRTRSRVIKKLDTKEEKWRDVSNRRNSLETDLRRLVKMTLKMRYDTEKAKELFLDIISPTKRKNKLSKLNLEDIFKDEIYLEDLRKVVVRNWDVFGVIFNNDKEHFNYYMEYINKHRIDAHAKDIDEDSLGILLMAFQWLQHQLKKFQE